MTKGRFLSYFAALAFLLVSLAFGPNLRSQTIWTDSVVISPTQPSLVSEDHTSEGFLVTLSSGTIVHIFRLDPGFWGHHIGNNGRIVKRHSIDGGTTWSSPSLVYDSQYDDRNIHGGLVGNDRIVLFFRRYDAATGMKVDFNIMYSDDAGNTFSEPQPIPTFGHASCNQHLTFIPSRGFLNAIYSTYYVELRFSQNGTDWDSIAHVWNYTQNQLFALTEVSFAYLGHGNIIGLFRNETGSFGSTYYQVSSSNYGETWSEPSLTQLGENFFCTAPLNFFDPFHGDLWTLACDRRGQCGPQYNHAQSRIYLYRNHPDEVQNNPLGYTLFDTIGRPNPSIYRLYGYPIMTRKQNGNYLIIFTESNRKTNFLENADFYQFEIQYQPLEQHVIPIQAGWNLISGNVTPNSLEFERIFMPVLSKTVIV
jgi:hypothetical protein